MLAWILDPRRAALLFSGALAVAYGVVPLVMGAVGFDPSFTKLGVLTLVSCAAILTGSLLPVGSVSIARTGVDGWVFVAIVWIPFIAFALLGARHLLTKHLWSRPCPGADPETIAILRERFLKAREGWQSSFVYINALFTAALIPYTLALMFVTRMKLRWLCFAFFLAYCLSFVEKTFFLKAMIPPISLLALERIRTPVGGRAAVAGALALLLALTVLSGAGQAEQETGGDFVSLQYAPQGAVEHIVWNRHRAANHSGRLDPGLRRDLQFDAAPWRHSSLLAFLFGMERVPFERLVFFDQWGQNETGTGSSNSVFVTEAYINFGMTGVIAISLIIGIMFQAMATSRDDALRALWPLLAFSLFTSGFIGVMASNGFALLFLVLLFFRLHDERRNSLLPIAKQHKILILKEINS